jgi:ABC-type glycerol-3-phosphate transport system substrate-binding protein
VGVASCGSTKSASSHGTNTSQASQTSVPATSASPQPTATINVWLVDNGTNVNTYWSQLAASFDKANPGDTVNIEISSGNNAYKAKVLAALATDNPPALFFSWGGGPLLQFIDSKVVQPFADPGVMDAGNPTWRGDFLPSSLGAVTFGNKVYGIPILGTQPVFFFYNKPLMARYQLQFPTIFPQLLYDMTALDKHDITTLALGNADEWEGLMYLEYFTDREGGPQVFINIQDNKKHAWSNPSVTRALSDIQVLARDNAFEKGYNSITYTNGFTDALVYNGVAAMQLMGDWDLGGLLADKPSFVNSGELGIAAFPTIPGGGGDPTDLEGNTTSYAALAAHIDSAKTYVAEQFVKWAFTTEAYAAHEVKFGLVPVIRGSGPLLNTSPLRQYLTPIYNAVENARYFQYSWDQALGPTRATPMLDNLTKVFDLLETPDQFEKAMNALQTGR